MSRTDSRFLLPHAVRTAVVIGGLEEWREGLAEAGVGESESPDLAVTTAWEVGTAIETNAAAILVEGDGAAGPLRAAGYDVRRFVSLPDPSRPEVLFPVDERRATRYALTEWIAASRRWKRLRNSALAALLRVPRLPVRLPVVTVAARRPAPPRLLAHAVELGLPANPAWVLAPAQGDLLSRGVFLVFAPGRARPSWVLKFARVAGWRDPFERDEEAYRFVAAAGETAARHAPRPVGRTSLDGLEMSVETAAVGPRLIAYLHSSAARRSKDTVVDRISSWLVELGRDTAARGSALEPELDRLEREVVPRWPVPADLVRGLGGVPAVLQHNDLGTWNVVVGGGDFTVLDWEDARRHGLPLWDLWYLLMDATAHRDGASTLDERENHFVRLFRGELASSARLFHWTRVAVGEQRVPAESVGTLATLCWMQHGLSSEARAASVKLFDPRTEPVFWLDLLERLARRWLEDPELGLRWDRWRDA